MRINKHTPPDNSKSVLLQMLADQKNEQYAKKLGALGDGEYKRVIIKSVLTAAAMLVVGIAIAMFALIGREIWHSDKMVPASAPDYPNYIFVEGKFAAIAHDGIFMQPLMMGRVVSYDEILRHECFYDTSGREIKEIYINASTLKVLNYGETETIASRLKKYASGEFRNYYKFTLPVQFDENEMPIPIYSDNIDYAFCEDEIVNGALNPEHKYVSAYKLDIKELADFKSTLKTAEIDAINQQIENKIDGSTVGYTVELDGDEEREKIVSFVSDEYSDSNAFSYVLVFDNEQMETVHAAFQSLQGEEIDKRELINLIDFDLDGKYEIVLERTMKYGKNIYAYSINEGCANEVFMVNISTLKTGITIREFAARVANMALGMEYDLEYPSDEACEWYFRYIETENINLDTPMSYNQIYFGIEAFAKMYNIELVGWDKETIWQPIANLYDPITTATRDDAEGLLQKARIAFEKSKFKINIDKERAASITITDPNAPNNKTITDKDEIEKIVEFLNKTPIKSAKYTPGLPTSGAPSLSVKDSEGNRLFGCMYEADKFYIRGCEYTLKDNYFANIPDIQ